MRPILLLTAALVTVSCAEGLLAQRVAPKLRTVTSQIEHIVVYRQGALVRRVGEVELTALDAELVFSGLETGIDAASLQREP